MPQTYLYNKLPTTSVCGNDFAVMFSSSLIFLVNPEFKVYESIVNQEVLKECLEKETTRFIKRFGECIYWGYQNKVSNIIRETNNMKFKRVHLEKTKSDSMKSLVDEILGIQLKGTPNIGDESKIQR